MGDLSDKLENGKERKSTLTVMQVELGLKTGAFVCKNSETRVKGSGAWDTFTRIYDVKEDKFIEFVQCMACDKILLHGRSTTNMLHHQQMHEKEAIKLDLNQNKVEIITSPNSTENSTAEFKEIGSRAIEIVRDKLTWSISDWCAGNLRPFDVVSDEYFVQIAQNLVSFGAKLGNFDVKRTIPHETTISRNIQTQYDRMLLSILPEVETAVDAG